jgi:lambda repressor-like predicted transcriptional regulator
MISISDIKNHMEANGITIYQLAKLTGLPHTTLHNIFEREDAKLSQVQSIVSVLGIDSEKGNTKMDINNADGLTNTLSNVRVGGDLKNVGNSKKNNGIGSDCEHLERLLAEKDLRLEEKERFIKMQQELIESLKKK